MSTCISREGEYSDHEPGDWCPRCGTFNEEAIVAERDRLRTEVERLTAPPTDDEREALWRLIHRLMVLGKVSTPQEVADAILAAGFRRQGPITDDWEYGLTWEPSVRGDGAEPESYTGCETEAGAWETGQRLAGEAQTPKVWRRPVRSAVQAVPAGPWEPVEAAREAHR